MDEVPEVIQLIGIIDPALFPPVLRDGGPRDMSQFHADAPAGGEPPEGGPHPIKGMVRFRLAVQGVRVEAGGDQPLKEVPFGLPIEGPPQAVTEFPDWSSTTFLRKLPISAASL